MLGGEKGERAYDRDFEEKNIVLLREKMLRLEKYVR